jgi:hypothetical protein
MTCTMQPTAGGSAPAAIQSRHPRDVMQAERRWPLPTGRAIAWIEPRQISPRKVFQDRAEPAATHGLMSMPSTGAPIRNSRSSSGAALKHLR